jgi:putative membrane protein
MPDRKTLLGLGLLCVVTWIVAAIHPLDRQAWFLENILLILFVGVTLFAHRRLQLSNASYICIAIFVLIHIVGAHYTYARMPVGLWVKTHFSLARNPYDRFAHAAFGFLIAFPLRELLLRFSGITRGWSFYLTTVIILAVSGVFEIIEATVAEQVAPGQGVDWLGGQGDQWDAQNDVLSATIGAVLMMILVAVTQRKHHSR